MLEYYNQLVESGQIKPDAAQKAVAEKLEALAVVLAAENPKGWQGRARQVDADG
jgi:predicted ATPase